MNKKYDIANRVNGYAGNNAGTSQGQTNVSQGQEASPWAHEPSAGHGSQPVMRDDPFNSIRDNVESPVSGALPFKKAPPPPPGARKTGPPPVPLGSKPRG